MQSSTLEQFRPGTDWLECSLACEQQVEQLYRVVQKWGNCILGYIKRLREFIITLYLMFVRLYFEHKVTFQTSQFKIDIDVLEQGWWKTTNMKRGLGVHDTWGKAERNSLFSLKKKKLNRNLTVFFSYPAWGHSWDESRSSQRWTTKREQAMVTKCSNRNSD